MAFQNTDHMSRFEKCRYYCNHGATFIFSHIGLCSLVFGYTLIGAFTFVALEANNERQHRIAMIEEEERIIERLWELTTAGDVLNESLWSECATTMVKSFESQMVEAVRKYGYDGKGDTENLQWSFSGALLYSIIVITTIGYGNIVPRTEPGKIVTILYAIVGIPLLLLCLSNIGDAMAHSFRFIYWKVCCYLCASPKSHHRKARSNRSSRYPSEPRTLPVQSATTGNDRDQMASRRYGGTPTDSFDRQKSYTNSMHQPLNRNHSFYSNKEAEFSDAHKVPIISNKYALLPRDSLDHQNPLYPFRPSGAIVRQPNRIQEHFQPLADEMSYEVASSIESEKDDEEEEAQASIPIMVCIAIVVSYIFGGAILFSYWEGWTIPDSCYFCFITLTTIGFGDMVPGTAVLSDDAQLALGLCSLYLLFGMALIAMSFNLVQEEVKKSVKSIGEKLGILSEDDDDDDDS